MTTPEEENGWKAAAAAYDDGKGIPLEEIDPDDKETMNEVYSALNVNNFGAKARLKQFIRRLQQQQQQEEPSGKKRLKHEEQDRPNKETTWRTPTKAAMLNLGIPNPEAASPNEALNVLIMRMAEIKLQHRYTTQNESEIGKRIQDDCRAKPDHAFKVDNLHLSFDFGGEIDASLMDINPNSSSQAEDLYVNEPFQRVLASVCKSTTFVKFTGKRSNLIDFQGREQGVDLSLLDSPREEWASVITVLEGKTDFSKPNWDFAIGQCMRRAKAILQAQPWRAKVVVPFYTLEQIAFLEVEWVGESRDFGYEVPRISQAYSCLVRNDEGVEAGEGFRALAAMLDNTTLFGYLPCPVSIDHESLSRLGFSSAQPICARSARNSKAVFVGNQSQTGEDNVLKVYLNRSAAEYEHRMISTLGNLPGAISLQNQEVAELSLSWEGELKHGYALVLSPYCHALTPTTASMNLFGLYAIALRKAMEKGICNNDISPDNLLVKEGPEGSVAVIADWECSSPPGSAIARTTGKALFCPYTEENETRMASLLGDLESLYYVAIACAENGARWAQNHRGYQEMLRERQRYTGMWRKSCSFTKWHSYLVGVRDALLRAKASDDCGPVVEAFCAPK